ncbi:peroxide stress protein YaaA [Demequina sp.]|uniref:YaaA family protein n=1 Tax=Demequina sp. TaxID=2050685 RepID=UPI0025BCE548|nr:peroxide stress protein YaaA [Demequina sp.]
MLVLLPPSEGKTPATEGEPVDLSALSHPALADARRRVGDTLSRVSGQRNAMRVLDVGPSLADDVARNTRLWTEPTARAASVYSGVLYDAAGMAQWDNATMHRAHHRVRIISALWGAVSPADLIPAYRLSMATTLPRIGGLSAYWKKHLDPHLTEVADGSVVVDCRSSSYAAAWAPRDAPWLAVRVLRELDGRRTVVSHMAKHTRGLLTAHLMGYETAPQSPQDVADAAASLVGASLVDVALEARNQGPDHLTVVVAG